MAGYQGSVAWWCFARALEPQALVEQTLRAGYAGNELAPREEWARIADAGLTIAATGGHKSIEAGLNRRANHDRIESEIVENLKLAQEWGIPNLICFSGNRDGLADDAGAEATIEGFQRVAKAAEDAGVTLILELLNSKVNHADYQADRTQWGVDVVRAVNSPRVKLLYDIYHMQIMEGDIIRTIGEHHQWFGHYHVAGNPGRNEPDASQELNYPPIYTAIAQTGYEGFIGMEFVPAGDAATALNEAWSVCAAAIYG